MRIAQVSPLYEPVPPIRYGGTERVVSFLTEELVRQGHDVTLFASGDSLTAARLVPACAKSLRTNALCRDAFAHHVLQLEQVLALEREFDLVHFHTGYMHYPIARRLTTPHLTTLHGRLDLDDLRPLFREFADMPVVSISVSQREPFPYINWRRTVHHGLPPTLFMPGRGHGDYLLFLGRIAPEKGPERAIAIARKAGRPLWIAAKVDAVDREYYDETIKPLIDGRHIRFLGEVDDREKQTLLGDALALLFPIDWPEPFGVVMIESLACGTPVIAWRNGSAPEVIEDGLNGFLVDSVEHGVRAVSRIDDLSRSRCRQVFEERFTVDRMAREYVATYEALVAHRASSSKGAAA